jgi:hypothetical protein
MHLNKSRVEQRTLRKKWASVEDVPEEKKELRRVSVPCAVWNSAVQCAVQCRKTVNLRECFASRKK